MVVLGSTRFLFSVLTGRGRKRSSLCISETLVVFSFRGTHARRNVATCHHQNDIQGSSGITTHLLEGRSVGFGSLQYQMVDCTRDLGNSCVPNQENVRIQSGHFSEVALSCTRSNPECVGRSAVLDVFRSTLHTGVSLIRASLNARNPSLHERSHSAPPQVPNRWPESARPTGRDGRSRHVPQCCVGWPELSRPTVLCMIAGVNTSHNPV